MLGALGLTRVINDEQKAGYGTKERDDFYLTQDSTKIIPAAKNHIAFCAHSKDAVDKFYRAAIAAGGESEGAPGIRAQYHAGYYAAFVRDPDGYKIEAVFHDREIS